MYKSIFVDRRRETIHLWDDINGYEQFPLSEVKYAYRKSISGTYISLYGDKLEKITQFDEEDPTLFESDVSLEMKFLLDRYPGNEEVSKNNNVVVIDIEVDITGGFPNVDEGDKAITAIALYDQTRDKYYSLILDPDKRVSDSEVDNVITRSFRIEENLLNFFLNKWEEIYPSIVSGWNCIPLEQSVWLKNKIVKIKNINTTSLYDSKLLKKYPISIKEKWELELCNGKRIYSSGDHRFPVILTNPNEYTTFKNSNKSNFAKIDLKTRQISSFKKCLDIYCAVQIGKNENPDNIRYTSNQIYLAGLVYTDGSLKDKDNEFGGYTFYQSDYDFMNKLDEFGIETTLVGPYKGCYSRYIKRSLLGDAHELIYDSNLHKRINLEFLSTLSYNQFMVFLSGLLDGDGYISQNCISWCNYNGDLDSIHELCNWNGIFCTQGKYYLRFVDFIYSDLSLLKDKRWNKCKISLLNRTSKQKSKQIRFKKIDNVYWVKVKDAKYIGTSTRMMDIETDSHYFITSGIRTHNCNNFDLPYLYNRITAVLGKQRAYGLSPIGISYQNKFNKKMVIAGISSIDYMELYKKFLGVMKSSYSLANVAKDEELSIQKLTYKGNLNDLYKNDIGRFVEYNLVDVKVVVELDKKYDFIHLAQSVCHKGHVPYEWFQMSSRWIDGAILDDLHSINIVGPNKPEGGREEMARLEDEDEEGFEGAYVKEPMIGLHNYVCSADITSLYPSVIMSLNISKETLVGKIINWEHLKFSSGEMKSINIGNDIYQLENFKQMISNHKFSIATSGAVYRQDTIGVIPRILDKWFSERVKYRKLAQEYAKSGDKVKELFFDRRQKREKIFLNSIYGITGLPISRWYNKDNAEAVTVSGQYIIKKAEELVNDYFNTRLNSDKDWVIAIDTDSNYFSVDPLLILNNITEENKVKYSIDILNDICKNINLLYEYMVPLVFNVSPNKNRIKIVPDVVSRRAMWLAKKRYAMLKVYDMEKNKPVKDKNGNEGKLEVKGIDIVRSSYPPLFRKFSAELLEMMLRGIGRDILDEKILQFEEHLNEYSIFDLAKTSSARYISKDGEKNYNPVGRILFNFEKGTPSQVKGALAYNDFLKAWKLDKQVEKIESGSKVKWLHVLPNDFCIKQIAFKGDDTDPDKMLEFISNHVDKQLMYDKELRSKIEDFYSAVKWKMPNRGGQLGAKTFNFEESW